MKSKKLILPMLIICASLVASYYLTKNASVYQSKALSAVDSAFTVITYQQDFSTATYLDPYFWTPFSGAETWNGEKQYYYAPNVTVSGGTLNLIGKRESVGGYNYTSGKINSRLPIKYGKFEVVAKVPHGRGVWPAIWLYDGNGSYGEIDIMEYIGNTPNYLFSTIHFGKDGNSLTSIPKDIYKQNAWKDYHTYTLEWTANKIEIYIDGASVFFQDMAATRINGISPLDKPLTFMINNALGGDWPGQISNHIFPAEFKIKSIKVWKWNP